MDASADRSGEIIEKFKLEELLGEGGMGQVYIATHQLTDRKVAIKILHREFANNSEILMRLKREAKASAIIGHPNVVEIIDAGTDQYGAPYIAMELLNGEELDKLLERKGPLPVPLAAYIVSEILDTLQAAHNKGVIHRDLKPENIFLHWTRKSKYPQIKILDFGISKFLSMEGKDLSLTRTGTVMGTPYYMSVEQAMGQKDIDHRTDIYAVGVILYQLLTNHVPYEDTNYNRVLIQIVTGTFPPPSQYRDDIPPELEQIILKAMAKDRDQRFSNAEEFKNALTPFWKGYSPEVLFSEDLDLPAPMLKDGGGPNVLDSQVLTAVQSQVTPAGGTTVPPGEMKAETAADIHRDVAKKKYIILGSALAAAVVIIGGGYFALMGGSNDEDIVINEGAQKTATAQDAPMAQDAMASPMAQAPGAGAAVPAMKEVVAPKKIKLRLVIDKLPKKAVVLLDGKKVSIPAELEWQERDIHSVNVKAPGYVSWGTRVSTKMVKDGEIHLTFDAPREKKAGRKHRSNKKHRSSKEIKKAQESKPKPKPRPMKAKPRKKKNDDPWAGSLD